MTKISLKIKLLKYLSDKEIHLVFLVSILTLVDILFLKIFYLIVSSLIFFVWLSIIMLYKFKERQIAIIIAILFIFIALFHAFNIINIVEKSAIWAYLFLIIYAYFLIKENKDPD